MICLLTFIICNLLTKTKFYYINIFLEKVILICSTFFYPQNQKTVFTFGIIWKKFNIALLFEIQVIMIILFVFSILNVRLGCDWLQLSSKKFIFYVIYRKIWHTQLVCKLYVIITKGNKKTFHKYLKGYILRLFINNFQLGL